MENHRSPKPGKFSTHSIMEFLDVGPKTAMVVMICMILFITAAVVYFVRSAPPSSITITSGAEGSIFHKTAQKYAAILEKSGVKVKVLTSDGSIENLKRLEQDHGNVDVGMVQGGVAEADPEKVISLGSISHQPLLIFYRGKPIELLSDLKKKKVAVGNQGSGTNQLARTLLAANGIKDGDGTTLVNMLPLEAAKEIQNHTIDAAFIMSESASLDVLKELLRAKDIHLYSFRQMNAYTRKLNYLEPLVLPEGAIDFGEDIPNHDVNLVGPVVELVAVKHLHPALSDLLLEAATQIHGRPGIFQQRGQFPNAAEHTIPISEDAARYHKSGKTFLYRYLPFWLASLLSRILVVLIPMLVVLIPVMKSIPALFRWMAQVKIYQRYRELLTLEHQYLQETDTDKKLELRKQFDRIEQSVNNMKIKAKFADQVYGLRGHIDYVRRIVANR